MILTDILDNKRIELAETKKRLPLRELEVRAANSPAPRDFIAVLKGTDMKIIAEIKRASPSKGTIAADIDPIAVARIFARHGAAAISVLTEARYFMGNIEFLSAINSALGESRPPLLRKDFLFDPYQIYEARTYGADAVLLIARIVPPQELQTLIALTRELKMEALVEVHNEAEINTAVESGAAIIGINNRDLDTFRVDLKTTERLRGRIPDDKIVVSESGIRDRTDIAYLRECRVDAVLIGEALIAAPDIAAKMRELL